jgi:hypothetical protein
MSRPSLDVIWQRDRSRPRYRRPDGTIHSFVDRKPREYEWICALLDGFALRHHADDRFTVQAPAPIVVLEGGAYDAAQVRRYLRRLALSTGPVGLLHIGDEFRRADLSVYDDAFFVYRNYWRPAMQAHSQCRYLPLGVNCPLDLFSPRAFSDRRYLWSFAGQHKGSRERMIETVAGRSDGYLVVNDDFNSGLSKTAYAQLLADTKVVLCPRGFAATESYRVYEALEAGAVPLVEDDGGATLWREHVAPRSAWRALTGGPSYWFDLARRSRRPSYWRSAYGPDVPFPRIYRWENVSDVLDRLDLSSLAPALEAWWTAYKSTLRSQLFADIQRHHPSNRLAHGRFSLS